MGTFVPQFRVAPDGTRVPALQYDQYIQNTYLPSQDFANSAAAPIPGVSAPVGTGAGIPQPGVGLQPPQQMPSFATPFQSNGRYGLLAQQLAGVGGPNMQIPRQPDPAQAMGLLGPKRGRMMGGPGGK